jgi:hypothetical protein
VRCVLRGARDGDRDRRREADEVANGRRALLTSLAATALLGLRTAQDF